MDEDNPNLPNLPQLYGQISRLYNSSISVFTATLFSWIAFIGLILNQTSGDNPSNKIPLLMNSGLLVFSMSSLYFFIRILRLGRFIARIENDLGLRDYINNLPKLLVCGFAPFGWLENAVGRPDDDPERWSAVEIVASIVLLSFFVVTVYVLISNV